MVNYINIVTHHTNISQPGMATERSENVASLCSPAWEHITTPPGSIPKAPEIWIPPYNRHTVVVPTVSSLEGLHCSLVPSWASTCTLTRRGEPGNEDTLFPSFLMHPNEEGQSLVWIYMWYHGMTSGKPSCESKTSRMSRPKKYPRVCTMGTRLMTNYLRKTGIVEQSSCLLAQNFSDLLNVMCAWLSSLTL